MTLLLPIDNYPFVWGFITICAKFFFSFWISSVSILRFGQLDFISPKVFNESVCRVFSVLINC